MFSQGDGQLYQSPDGATFFLQCCNHGSGSFFHSFIATDFKSCMDKCSETDECLRLLCSFLFLYRIQQLTSQKCSVRGQ